MVEYLVAYARFWDSDIYIYPHVGGYIQCYGSCGGAELDNDIDLLRHIGIHRDKGEDIPYGLELEILNDSERYGAI